MAILNNQMVDNLFFCGLTLLGVHFWRQKENTCGQAESSYVLKYRGQPPTLQETSSIPFPKYSRLTGSCSLNDLIFSPVLVVNVALKNALFGTFGMVWDSSHGDIYATNTKMSDYLLYFRTVI